MPSLFRLARAVAEQRRQTREAPNEPVDPAATIQCRRPTDPRGAGGHHHWRQPRDRRRDLASVRRGRRGGRAGRARRSRAGWLADQLLSRGGRAIAVPTDVADPASVERLVDRTVGAFGRLDLAFNNAAGGGQRPTPLADLPVDAYDSAITITLRGVFLSMRYEIPAMLEAGGGVIVNMSSTAGLEGVGGLAGYVSAKHGVIGLTKTAALDYADRNLRVNALAPGPILTDDLKRAGEDAQRLAALAMPMRRIGRPEEVAAAVVWLCSDQAAFITGATLPIDGGKLAGAAPFRSTEGQPHGQ
jgi:NAD(P)-dependent dehydrogenase (short-subunit alcohol dehydrogenase family)